MPKSTLPQSTPTPTSRFKSGAVRSPAFPSRAPRLVALATVLGGASIASAQGVRQVDPQRDDKIAEARAERKWDANLRLFGEYTFESDLDDDEGKVSVARAGGAFGFGAPIGDRSRLGFTFQTEYSSYSWDNASSFAQGMNEPWGDGLEHTLLVTLSTQATERWSFVGGGAARSTYEVDAGADDSFTFGGFGAATYKFSETFSLGGGVQVRSQLEDDALVLPLIFIDWKISERWRLGGKAGGPGVGLFYQASENLTLFLDGDYQTRAYRLDNDGPAPDGVGRDERLQIAIGADWKITNQVRLNARVGAAVYQEYELLDENGVQVTDRQADPAPFVGLELRFDF